ncbi:MAG: ABC transporter permease [Oscillospiraceae bacterium]|jgi:ribose/xylose/arabinose/galactoside ABC-type transport system permease subunit|nr:ABC transporter permease [Oscillospiraceae bacterium]
MKKNTLLQKLVKGKAMFLLLLILVVLAITYIVKPASFTIGNAKQLMQNISFIGVISVGVCCLFICGGIDFSTSAHATVGMVFFALCLQKFESVPWPVFILAPVVFGIIAGLVNAFFSEVLNLMPFIATIGMQSVWSGGIMWYVNAQPIQITRASFTTLATKYIGPVPVFFLFFIALAIIYSIALRYTTLGRSMYMVGGNPAAARLAGINISRTKTLVFINNGILAALGGLVWASQQGMGSPNGLTSSTPEMTAMSASILGGVAFSGGAGGLGGAFFGVCLVTALTYALQAMGLPLWTVTMVNGLLLVTALTLDSLRSRKQMKAMQGMGMPGMSR